MALGWQCEWAYAGLLQEEAPLTDFYDIHELKRCELLTEVLRRFSQADVETLGQLALTEDRTPEQIWAEICRAKNIEPCSIPTASCEASSTRHGCRAANDTLRRRGC